MAKPDIIVSEPKPRSKGFMKTFGSWLVYFLILGVAYWFWLPPIHWQSSEFWLFVVLALVLRLLMVGFAELREVFQVENLKNGEIKENMKKTSVLTKVLGIGAALIVVFMLISAVLGFEIFNATGYAGLMTTENGDFSIDVAEIPMSSIPVVDLDTAQRLGSRELGAMSDLVSQFEVDETFYTQINYKGSPYRVTPLRYGDMFKWFGNQAEGIPAYITVNMVTQETELVRLKQGIKYSESEYFMRDLKRHLRFQYPTKIFDNISFELDDNGVPYWVASTVGYRVGVWDGRDINGAVLCNAVTGECSYYELNQVPTWVDQVYSSDILLEQLTYNGEYQSGYWNSIFGQKGVLQPTDGHNYIAMNDDVYLYTGMTSAAGDESNVGFVLVNLRTKQAKYYTCPGAEEYSAMESAEGMVQDLGYSATFPLLLNVADRPTYFVALKDSAGLVKKYAYIDMQQYQVVGIGNTIAEARETYTQKLKAEANVEIESKPSTPEETSRQVSGVIQAVSSAVVEGNTCYYILLEQDQTVYIANVSISERLPFAKEGLTVTLTVPLEEKDGPVTVINYEVTPQSTQLPDEQPPV
ncbi:MAG: CvpA family protein [Clostridia bacterium]|nr:CvpA family protein [Clostridia bacterium]